MLNRALIAVLLLGTLAAPLAAQTRLTVAPTGNEARYMVRELLAANTVENDVVGTTDSVSGTIVLDKDGKVVAAESKITVILTGLKTDQRRRDGYVQRNTLQTADFPTTTLAVTAMQGLPTPLPTSGDFSFTLVGDLTLKGVTKPTTWTVNATASATGFTGVAKTSFTFAEFELTKPRIPVVARVDDPITLELQFNLLKQ